MPSFGTQAFSVYIRPPLLHAHAQNVIVCVRTPLSARARVITYRVNGEGLGSGASHAIDGDSCSATSTDMCLVQPHHAHERILFAVAAWSRAPRGKESTKVLVESQYLTNMVRSAPAIA